MDDVNTDTLPTPSAETPAGGASVETPEVEIDLEPEAVGDDQAEDEDERECGNDRARGDSMGALGSDEFLHRKQGTQRCGNARSFAERSTASAQASTERTRSPNSRSPRARPFDR